MQILFDVIFSVADCNSFEPGGRAACYHELVSWFGTGQAGDSNPLSSLLAAVLIGPSVTLSTRDPTDNKVASEPKTSQFRHCQATRWTREIGPITTKVSAKHLDHLRKRSQTPKDSPKVKYLKNLTRRTLLCSLFL